MRIIKEIIPFLIAILALWYEFASINYLSEIKHMEYLIKIRLYITLLVSILMGLSTINAQSISPSMSATQIRQLVQNSSKEELLGYVAQAKESGYTLAQVKSLLRARGASISELSELDKIWNQYEEITDSENNSTENIKYPIKTNFGNAVTSFNDSQPINEIQKINNNRFGSQFFNNSVSRAEVPELYIATPKSYQIGPGDELFIALYGASEETYDLQVSKEGTILIDRLGPIFLSGLSIADAEKRISNRLSAIYAGLNASDKDPSKVRLSLSLKKARSVVVNITGQAQKPGTYTISAFSSVINALYAAGGPNEVGSFRSIRLIRGGKLLKEIDLYDFFVSGVTPLVYLQDQDVLHIPTYTSQVEFQGAFKITGLFELKEQETLADALNFCGGFISDGFKEKVFISRLSEFKRESLTISISEARLHPLMDGDVVSANLINDSVEQSVIIQGGVYLPGTYSLSSVKTVNDLLEAAGGFTRQGLKGQSTLFRTINGVESSAISINLDSPSGLNFLLKDGDRLLVPEESKLFDSGQISVKGEVNTPGIFQYKKGMSLSDALLMANGFTSAANKEAVSVYQNFLNEDSMVTQSETVSVDARLITQKPILLQENALVVVRKDPNYRKVEEVTLQGLVKNEGKYAIKGDNYRLYDLFRDSGGFLNDAYLKGISVSRTLSSKGSLDNMIIESSVKDVASDLNNNNTLLNQQSEALGGSIVQDFEKTITIGIDGEELFEKDGQSSEYNIFLKEGDIINVPKFDNTVTIIGEVQKNTTLTYDKGISLKKAIRRSGGFLESSKRSKVYVVYKNGSVASRNRILGLFMSNPKIEPGSTVVVPEKIVKRDPGSTLTELVGISSSLATLFLLLQQLGL